MKIILVERNVQNLFCILNAIRRKENEEVAGTSDDVELFIHCASREFHEYREIWLQQFGQKLNIKRDKINLFDTYDMGLYCEIKRKIDSLTLVGYLPREIPRFCKYFLEYNGELDATVLNKVHYRRAA